MNSVVRTLTLVLLAGVMLAASLAWGQYGWQRRPVITQNAPPATEFVAARWRFGTNGYIGHMGWSHNYPRSDRNLNAFLMRATTIHLEEDSFLIMELGSEEVFDYPFAYVSEPGEMLLTDTELLHLREYVARGGFIIMDDFDGPVQWAQMHSQIKRAFPNSDFVELSEQDPVFRTHIQLDNLQAMASHVPGGSITYYGLFDDRGNLAILAGHNNDLANFWDWYGSGRMPLAPSTDAFRLGANAVMHALTH